jgi:putative ABC transport system permease protein
VAALSLWVRRMWTRRWAGLLGLGLMIAVVGGVTLAVTAGARRTASAFHRLEAATNAPSIQVELAQEGDATLAQYADMPSAASLADQITRVRGVDGVAVASFVGATPDPDGSWFAVVTSEVRGAAPSARLVSGRLPDPSEPNEIVVNEAGAAAWHTGVGRKLQIHTLGHDQMTTFMGLDREEPHGPTIDADVVGITRGVEEISDVPEPIFLAGPGFLERWGGEIAQLTAVALVKADDRHAETVIHELNDRLAPHFVANRAVDRDDFASRVNDTIDVEVTGLTIFAVAAALAGLVVVGQALARTIGGHEPEQESLAALGVTRPEATMGSVGSLVPALLLGLIGSIVLAVALSPLFPRGLAHRAEPAPGLRIDAPVVLGGALTLFVVLLALAGLASWRVVRAQSRHAGRETRSRPPVIARLATVLPPVPSLGAMFALEAGPRRRAIGGLAGIVGAAVLVGGIVGVATVERSRHALLTTGDLYGAAWDYQLDLEGRDDAGVVLPKLIEDRDLTAVGTRSQLRANGGDLDVRGPKGAGIAGPVAYTSHKGSIPPVLAGGRPPGPGEVVLGRRLARRLGVSIGDSVTVTGYAGDVPLVVTGWFVNPGQDDLDLGILVARDTLERFARHDCPTASEAFPCQIEEEGAAVVVRPDADRAAVERRLTAIEPDFVRVSPPSVVANLAAVGATPWLLAGFLALIGGAGLAHALIVGVRRRRRDLAVVRAIGLRPGQAHGVVTWSAFVMAVIGAGVGTLIGLLAGRMVWERVATGIGAIVRVHVPVVALLLAPALAIGLGLALSLVAGRRAAGLRPALVLRAE